MAGVMPVVTIVTPLEHVVKELRSSQLKIDEPLIPLLERGSVFIKAGIAQLPVTPLQPLSGAESYVEDLMTLFNKRMAYAADANTETVVLLPRH